MWPLRRVAHPLKKQAYFVVASRVFGAKPDALSNVRGEGPSIYCPAQSLSTRGLWMELFHGTPLLDRIFVGSRSLCSQTYARNKSENPDVKEGFLEPEIHAVLDVNEENNAEVEDGEAVASEPETLDSDLSDAEEGEDGKDSEKRKAYLELCKAIMDAPRRSVESVLDKWAEEGNDLDQLRISRIIVSLRKRRMYGKTLQFLNWLDATKTIELTERYYASRLDLIVKAQGIQKAVKYIDNIPKSFRGEQVYQALLAGFVRVGDKMKAEALFKNLGEMGLPTTVDACNQMIILYKKLDRRKVADILLLMEKENVKPSLLTYKLLIDMKGESSDIVEMEQLFETMKAEGVVSDIYVLTKMAEHYISGGLKDKALTVLKEIEGGELKESIGTRSVLLPLYASLGHSDDVGRLWKDCELGDPTIHECVAAIEAWGKLGKVEEAEAIFNMMLKKWNKLSSKHYCALLKVYVNHKLVTKGKEFVKQMGDGERWIDPFACDAIVRLYLGAGDLEEADSILQKVAQQRRMRPLFTTYMIVMKEYAKRGDIHNTEKLFQRMTQQGYAGRLKRFEILIQAYINAKVPAYGFRERMKAENTFPNKAFAEKLAQADAFRKKRVPGLLD